MKSRVTGPWIMGVLDVYDGNDWRLPPFDEARLVTTSTGRGVVSTRVPAGHQGDDHRARARRRGAPDDAEHGRRRRAGPAAVVRLAQRQHPARRRRDHVDGSRTRSPVRRSRASRISEGRRTAGRPRPQRSPRRRCRRPPHAALIDEAPKTSLWARWDYMRRYVLDKVTVSGAGSPVASPDVAGRGGPHHEGRVAVRDRRRADAPRAVDRASRLASATASTAATLAGDHREIRPRDGAVFPQVYFEGNGWLPGDRHPGEDEGDGHVRSEPPAVQAGRPAVGRHLRDDLPSGRALRPSTLLYERLRDRGARRRRVPCCSRRHRLPRRRSRSGRRCCRSRRRADAFERGTRARIAQAYAEFRDLLTDFGYHHETDTPLMLLRRFPPDDEHKQLAWLVTRVAVGRPRLGRLARDRRGRRGAVVRDAPPSARSASDHGARRRRRCRGCRCGRRTPSHRSTAPSRRTIPNGSSTMSRCRALPSSRWSRSARAATAASRVAVDRDQTDIVFGFTDAAPR